MSLDVDVLGSTMIDSARSAVGNRWLSFRPLAEEELRKLAVSLLGIERLLRAEHINKEHAQSLLQMHQRSVETVLLTVKGLGIKTAREVIRSGLGAVGSAVNDAVGFRLI